MISAENNQLIAHAARDIVAQTEPGELPLFRAISTEYFKRPAEALKNQASSYDLQEIGRWQHSAIGQLPTANHLHRNCRRPVT